MAVIVGKENIFRLGGVGVQNVRQASRQSEYHWGLFVQFKRSFPHSRLARSGQAWLYYSGGLGPRRAIMTRSDNYSSRLSALTLLQLLRPDYLRIDQTNRGIKLNVVELPTIYIYLIPLAIIT